MSDLRERVAEELWQADSLRVMGYRRSVPWSEAGPAAHNQWRPLADATIALVRDATLEEAAKACEALDKVLAPQQVITDRCAAAIRALGEKA